MKRNRNTRSVKKRSTFKQSSGKSGTYGAISKTRRFKRMTQGLTNVNPNSTKLGSGSARSSAVFRKGKYSISHAGKLRQQRELIRLEKDPKLNKKKKARLKYLKKVA